MGISRRDMLTAGALAVAAGSARTVAAQTPPPPPPPRPPVPRTTMKTTPLFKSPALYPNGLAVNLDAPGGLWIAQQKISPSQAAVWGQPVPANRDEAAWLVDWNGKLLKTVNTPSRNTSGLAFGDHCVWMGANDDPYGIFQVDMNGKLISHRQIPLALPGQSGGGCHGCQWQDGKLWIAALRMGGAMRVDPKTWVAEVVIPIRSDERPRLHDLTFDGDGNMWVVTGTNARSYAAAKPALNKYNGKTGQLMMIADLAPGSADPHGLVWHEGHLYSCDAGVHPDGWKDMESPFSGYIFRIDPA